MVWVLKYIKFLCNEINWIYHEKMFGLGELDIAMRGTLINNIFSRACETLYGAGDSKVVDLSTNVLPCLVIHLLI